MTDGATRRSCPDCGSPLTATDLACPGCGAEVVSASATVAKLSETVSQAPLLSATAMDAAAGRFCTDCGRAIPSGAKFCPHCGAAQAESAAQSTGRRLRRPEPTAKRLPTGWWMLPLAVVVGLVGYWLLRRPTPVPPAEPVAVTMPAAATAQLAEMQARYDGARTPEARRELGTQLSALYVQADQIGDGARVLSEIARTTPEPEAAAVWLRTANLYHDSGDNLEAIAAYEQVLRRTPDDVDARVDMGTCYYRLRRYDEARAAMLEAIRRQPTHQIAHLNLGVIETARGEAAAGRTALERAVELDPATPAGRQAKTLLDGQKLGPS